MLAHDSEIHISSAIVQCHPEALNQLCNRINTLEDVSVEASGSNGKIVVLLETSNEQVILTRLGEIDQLEGVICTHLVFHQID